MKVVLPVHAIQRSTVAAWRLWLAWSDDVRRDDSRYLDAVACCRTAVAEVYRYDDLRDVDRPVWTFYVQERRHNGADDLEGKTYAHGLRVPGDEVHYPTWRACFDAACNAVTRARHG